MARLSAAFHLALAVGICVAAGLAPRHRAHAPGPWRWARSGRDEGWTRRKRLAEARRQVARDRKGERTRGGDLETRTV